MQQLLANVSKILRKLVDVLAGALYIIVWMEIAKARGKPEWWGILIIVPVANLIGLGYLAFAD